MSHRNKLRRRREALDLSQEQVAVLAGITKQYVWMLESGRANPSLPVARKLAAALDCEVDDVFPQERA